MTTTEQASNAFAPYKAPSLDGVRAAISNARTRLQRGRATDEASFVRHCVRLEDWLEYEHPRHPLRPGLRGYRRRLETRCGG